MEIRRLSDQEAAAIDRSTVLTSLLPKGVWTKVGKWEHEQLHKALIRHIHGYSKVLVP